MADAQYDFDVALCFAGEDRDYVEKTAGILRRMGFRVFYDKYETVSSWGKNLYEDLTEVFHTRAAYTVMFVSRHFAEKLWPNHERKSAQARAFKEQREYILPARFDDTEIPGLLDTVAYIDLRQIDPEQLADMIKEKIGPVVRDNFFPETPDRLYPLLRSHYDEDLQQINVVAKHLFEQLGLMRPLERQVLSEVVLHSCPTGPPNNVHINLEYLGRLVSLSREEILSLFSGLDSLGFVSRVYFTDCCEEGSRLKEAREIIEVRFEPGLVGYDENQTLLLVAMWDSIFDALCPVCASMAIDRLDFSVLGSLTAFPEVKHEHHDSAPPETG